MVAFVDAAVLHLLDVRQRVEGAAEVGFPRLGILRLALRVFPCDIDEGEDLSIKLSAAGETTRRAVVCLFVCLSLHACSPV